MRSQFNLQLKSAHTVSLCKLFLLSVIIFSTMENFLSPDAFMSRSDFINAARLLKICSPAIFSHPIKPQNLYKAILLFFYFYPPLLATLTDHLFALVSINTFSDRQGHRQLREIGGEGWGTKLKLGGKGFRRNAKAFSGRNHKLSDQKQVI